MKTDLNENYEEKLRDYLSLLDSLINSISDPIFFMDNEDRYQGCNKSFGKLVLGLTRAQIIGKKHGEFNDLRINSFFLELNLHKVKLFNEENTIDFEEKILCTDGILRDYLVSLSLLKRIKDTEGCIGVMRDITRNNEDKKIEAALATAGTFCHEMNQPIQALSLYVNILRKQFESGTKISEYIQLMDEQILRMIEISSKLQTIDIYKTKNYPGNKRILDIE